MEKTKNDHFQDMLRESAARGLNPDCVLFDSWYGSVDNLRLVRRFGWHFLTRLKKNRQINPDKLGNKQIHEISIPSGGCVVHLKDYGMVRVFHRDDDGNGVQFWATDILDLEEKTRQTYAGYAFKIEEYHRNLKQYCGVERCQARHRDHRELIYKWQSGRLYEWNGYGQREEYQCSNKRWKRPGWQYSVKSRSWEENYSDFTRRETPRNSYIK